MFCLWLDREAEDFAVQKSEIDYVKWFDLDEAVAAVEQGTIPNCIFPEELGMVKKFVGQTGVAADPDCGGVRAGKRMNSLGGAASPDVQRLQPPQALWREGIVRPRAD